MGIGIAGTDITVQIDLSGTAYGGTPTWTDVTGYVLTADVGSPLQITWGRQDSTSDIGAASCSFSLDNRDGRFTPGLTSSPYYPHVKRRARCRVTATVHVTSSGLTFTDLGDGTYSVTGPGVTDNGDGTVTFTTGAFFDNGDGTYSLVDGTPVTVYLFDGLIDSWETTYTSGGRFSLTSVTAADMLGRLASDLPLRPMLYEEILKDVTAGGNGVFYPLNDQGPTLGDITGTYPTLPAFVGSGGPDIAYQNVTGCADTTIGGVGLGGYFSSLGGTVGFSISGGGAASLFFVTSFSGAGCDLIVDSVNGVAVGITPAGYINDGISAGPLVNDGLVHELVVVNGDGWYLDGVKYGTVSIGQVSSIGFNFVGTVFCFATYLSVVPSLTRFGQQLLAARTGFAGESTDVHITRLLSYRTNFGTSLNSGVGTVGVHSTDGVDVQQALYDTAEAEGSVVFADGQGRIVFLNRTWLFSPLPELTLDASQGEVEATTVFRDDTQFLVNDITVTTPSGATQRYTDPTSVAADGLAAQSLPLIVDSDAAALAAAKWRVQTGVQEQTSATQLDVNLFTVTATDVILGVLQLQPLDVVAVSGLTVPVPTTEQFMVQGGSLSIAVDEFSVSLFTTAVPAGDPY